jgi:hypothetical protein
MYQQLPAESSEKTKQRIEQKGLKPDPERSLRGERNSLLQLQQTFGNQGMARLIQTKQITSFDKLTDFQKDLPLVPAVRLYHLFTAALTPVTKLNPKPKDATPIILCVDKPVVLQRVQLQSTSILQSPHTSRTAVAPLCVQRQMSLG